MPRDDSQDVALALWSPERALRVVDAATARYSRGFLRCRPEKWFPGFGMQWLPLAHSLGVELKLVEAKPSVDLPGGLPFGFAGTVDGEPLGIAVDEEAAEILLEAVAPGSKPVARGVVLEYLARRLLASLVISWSGPESSVVQFEPEEDLRQGEGCAAVKLVASLGGSRFAVWLLLGQVMADKLDGLWRRQLQSTGKIPPRPVQVHVEFAHLTVPPSMLSDYLKSGTTVDLEAPLSDAVMLVSSGQPWLPARLCRLGSNFAVETLAGPLPGFNLPSGTTRLAVELGSLEWSGSLAREMAQPGAICDIDIRLSDRVNMVVNGEPVAEAVLRSYQGRFVVSVL